MYSNYISFITFILTINACVGKKYHNYTLYRAIPVNETHIDFFTNITSYYDVNFWKNPGMPYESVDFVISPTDRPNFLKLAEEMGLYVTSVIDDVQHAFDQQTVQRYIRRQMSSMNWQNYYRLADIYSWLEDLAKMLPRNVKIINIGKTHENRDILALSVLLYGDKSSERPTVIIEGGIHAREWIAPAVVTYLIYSIIRARHSKDDALRSVALNYEWYFVPILNPDGYEYTHTTDRLWRKNRHGVGVDLNRNFDHAFGTVGVSWDPKSDSYCGQKAFSEKETKAMADFIKSKSKTLQYYFSFHSYGQYMLLPYADSLRHMDNYDEVYSLCQEAAESIAVKYKTKYEIGIPSEALGYMSSGVSGCWVKKAFHVPYVVTFELRDTGTDGFALPTKLILPTCEETLDGMVSFLKRKPKTMEEIDNSADSYKLINKTVVVFSLILIIIVRFD